jgi:uncharacterized glyoxalase superfamily protein PhnB
MKKQLLIAAVAASMTSVAMADISISGSSKANVVDGVTAIEADLNVTGKSGATSVVANVSLDGTFAVEDLYMTSSFEGVNIKVGNYRSGKSELDVTSTASTRYNLSTSMGGVTATYEATAASHDLTLGGTVAGVSVKHKMKQNKDTETWISGSMSGVNVSWNQEKDDSASANNTALTVSTEVSGVTATYVKVDSDAGTVMDGFFGKKIAGSEVSKATGFALATSVAGNKITFKSLDVDSVDSTKVILNRALASGATFEAVYTNNTASKNTLDLELAVKF